MSHTLKDLFTIIDQHINATTNFQIEWWCNFYREEGIEINLSTFQIPERPKEYHSWPIMVAPGLSYDQVLTMTDKRFRIVFDRFDSLDKFINPSKEQRRAIDTPYVVWVKADTNVCREFYMKSAEDLKGEKTITLMERMLLDLFYFCAIAPGENLDFLTITLCAGSECHNGDVPTVTLGRHYSGKRQVRIGSALFSVHPGILARSITS